MRVYNEKTLQGLWDDGYYFQYTDNRPLSDILHSHTFYEFFYILSGSCIHEINGVKKEISGGTLVILKPGDSHRFISQSDNAGLVAISVQKGKAEKVFVQYNINAENLPHILLLSAEQTISLNTPLSARQTYEFWLK